MNMTGSLVGLGPNYSPDLVGGGSMSVSQSLVLDAEKCELVKSNAVNREGKKDGLSEEKIMAALKSHSEAERRRRERINAHLSTLRGLVPSNEKMDKAALLAEVISQVKQMKETANEASKGLLIPLDSDEVKITPLKAKGGGSLINSFTATLCCNYRPHLLSEVRQALNALHLTVVKAEISTLGSRVKHLFVFTSRNEMMMMIDGQALANSVHQALTAIVDKGSSVSGYSPRTTTTTDKKRQRISYIESSSSSS